jgi:hypothetical protein
VLKIRCRWQDCPSEYGHTRRCTIASIAAMRVERLPVPGERRAASGPRGGDDARCCQAFRRAAQIPGNDRRATWRQAELREQRVGKPDAMLMDGGNVEHWRATAAPPPRPAGQTTLATNRAGGHRWRAITAAHRWPTMDPQQHTNLPRAARSAPVHPAAAPATRRRAETAAYNWHRLPSRPSPAGAVANRTCVTSSSTRAPDAAAASRRRSTSAIAPSADCTTLTAIRS